MAIGSLCCLVEELKGDLTDPHSRLKYNWLGTEVGDFQSELASKPRINESCCVDNKTLASNGALAIELTLDMRRKAHYFLCASEDVLELIEDSSASDAINVCQEEIVACWLKLFLTEWVNKIVLSYGAITKYHVSLPSGRAEERQTLLCGSSRASPSDCANPCIAR